MATEGAHHHTPPNLHKSESTADKVKRLVPGDTWLIFYHEPIPPHVTVGFTLNRVYDTMEPGRLFKVKAMHPHCIETEYVGLDDGNTITGER